MSAVPFLDIRNCPKRSLLPGHYRPDGSCRCDEAQAALELLASLHRQRRALGQQIAEVEDWVHRT